VLTSTRAASSNNPEAQPPNSPRKHLRRPRAIAAGPEARSLATRYERMRAPMAAVRPRSHLVSTSQKPISSISMGTGNLPGAGGNLTRRPPQIRT